MFIAMLRAVTLLVAASTWGSIAPAYSAVHEPAALNSTKSPRVWPLIKIPAVTEALLHRQTATRVCDRIFANERASTGLDALRRDFADSPPADRQAMAAIQGPH
jgi:hypothetical protein